MNNKPLIRQLALRGCLSYGMNTKPIELRNLNVLIGPNSVGKSNLIEAISVLRAAAKDLKTPFRSSGIAEWLWKDPITFRKSETIRIQAIMTGDIRYTLELMEVSGSVVLVDESLEQTTISSGKNEPYFFYRYQNGNPVIKIISIKNESLPSLEIKGPERHTRNLPSGELLDDQSVLSQKNDLVLYPEIGYIAKQLGNISIYRLWDTGQTSPIRTPSRTDDPKSYLLDDASNLALVLNNFLMRGDVRNKLLSRLKSFYDRAEDIVFDIYTNRVQLAIRETGDNIIPASRLSDGTLRFLALLAMLYNPTPPSIICIEEPELGMHPDIIPVIAEMLIEAAEHTQLVVTTHSDLLVSKLNEVPESIVVCDWTNSGTSLRRLTETDVMDWSDDEALGDIWLKGGLGGTRW